MRTLSPLTWIGNAAAILCGPWGAVTAHAAQAGCSRQAAYDQAQRVHDAVTDAQAGGPDRAALAAQCQRLQEDNQRENRGLRKPGENRGQFSFAEKLN